MQRTVAALVAGLVVAVLCTTLIEAVGLWLYPPHRLDDSASFEERVRTGRIVPPAAQAISLAGVALGALAGCALAAGIAERAKREHAWIVGGLLLLGLLWSLLTGDHPWWYWLLAPPATAAAAYLGGRAAG